MNISTKTISSFDLNLSLETGITMFQKIDGKYLGGTIYKINYFVIKNNSRKILIIFLTVIKRKTEKQDLSKKL